jgi:hypothetical protein
MVAINLEGGYAMQYQIQKCSECRGTLASDEPGPAHAYHEAQREINRRRQAARKPSASALNGVCPRCGGTSFKAVRSIGRKVTLGFASLLTSANEVQCVMCGAKFKRG